MLHLAAEVLMKDVLIYNWLFVLRKPRGIQQQQVGI